MIYLSGAITWPFKYNQNSFKTYFHKIWQVTKHKFLEVESYGGSDDIIAFVFRIAWRSDHAGLMLDLSLFRQSLSIMIYDNRHWDHEKNTYIVYDGDEK